jgi:hypothetical protein
MVKHYQIVREEVYFFRTSLLSPLDEFVSAVRLKGMTGVSGAIGAGWESRWRNVSLAREKIPRWKNGHGENIRWSGR